MRGCSRGLVLRWGAASRQGMDPGQQGTDFLPGLHGHGRAERLTLHPGQHQPRWVTGRPGRGEIDGNATGPQVRARLCLARESVTIRVHFDDEGTSGRRHSDHCAAAPVDQHGVSGRWGHQSHLGELHSEGGTLTIGLSIFHLAIPTGGFARRS